MYTILYIVYCMGIPDPGEWNKEEKKVDPSDLC